MIHFTEEKTDSLGWWNYPTPRGPCVPGALWTNTQTPDRSRLRVFIGDPGRGKHMSGIQETSSRFWSHRSSLVYGPWRPLGNLGDRGVPRTSPCTGNGGLMHRKPPKFQRTPFGEVGEGEAWSWKESGQGLDKGLPERIANATALLRSGVSGQLWKGHSSQAGWVRVSKVWARGRCNSEGTCFVFDLSHFHPWHHIS